MERESKKCQYTPPGLTLIIEYVGSRYYIMKFMLWLCFLFHLQDGTMFVVSFVKPSGASGKTDYDSI